MTTPNRDSLANGLVTIGEEAVAKSNDALFYDYFTDDYILQSPPVSPIAKTSGLTSLRYAKASPTTRSRGRNSSSTATSSSRAA
jgi:hypothetical protein